jgi:hypothetical protein
MPLIGSSHGHSGCLAVTAAIEPLCCRQRKEERKVEISNEDEDDIASVATIYLLAPKLLFFNQSIEVGLQSVVVVFYL